MEEEEPAKRHQKSHGKTEWRSRRKGTVSREKERMCDRMLGEDRGQESKRVCGERRG